MNINDRYLDLVLFGVREVDWKGVGGRKVYLKTIWLWFRVISAAFPNQSLISHTRTFAPLGSPIMWLVIWQSCWRAYWNFDLFSLYLLHCLNPGPGKHGSVTSKLVMYFKWGWKGSEYRWLYSDQCAFATFSLVCLELCWAQLCI